MACPYLHSPGADKKKGKSQEAKARVISFGYGSDSFIPLNQGTALPITPILLFHIIYSHTPLLIP